ncbi:MAG TPA: N-acetylglucosamine-6-phosphate deacetylase [Hyphomonadaceae bacterium]|jgi:N-acetylglucosamine-6-phosphate deacetylase|nr:N-acetylglucosamine-6-phosphate deacetylase [Hyphomonadaceae bacterium]
MLELAPTRLFTGETMREGASVVIDGERVIEIREKPSPSATKLDGLLAPGFIDAQVNGGGGVLFNDAPTVETLKTMAAAHRQFGVTAFMATLISDDRAKTAKAINAVAAGIAAGTPGLLGIHLEGPWLSDARRGVHPSKALRPFDNEDLKLLAQQRPFPALITVAPEQIDAAGIRALRVAGVTISLGHTAATAEDVEAALAAGATGFTHLFNAMPPIEGRKPGAAGAALANRNAWAGLILDGIHVHPITARMALAAKTAKKLFLVSDAMATVGSKDPSMSLFGEQIAISDGALRTVSGTLAGAHLDLSGAVRNAVSMLGASMQDALRMASLTPAEFVGTNDRGKIAPDCRADLVLLGAELDVRKVWIGGKS